MWRFAHRPIDAGKLLLLLQSSVLASNNPFADLLSSSDATPDSVASEDVTCDASGSVVTNNPFISAVPKDQDDMDLEGPGTAAAVTQDDPWSSHEFSGWFFLNGS